MSTAMRKLAFDQICVTVITMYNRFRNNIIFDKLNTLTLLQLLRSLHFLEISLQKVTLCNSTDCNNLCKNRLVTVKCRINFICNQNQLGAPCLYQYIYRTNILSLYGAISLFQALRYNISKKLLGIINRLMKRNYLLLNRDTSLSLRNLL